MVAVLRCTRLRFGPCHVFFAVRRGLFVIVCLAPLEQQLPRVVGHWRGVRALKVSCAVVVNHASVNPDPTRRLVETNILYQITEFGVAAFQGMDAHSRSEGTSIRVSVPTGKQMPKLVLLLLGQGPEERAQLRITRRLR